MALNGQSTIQLAFSRLVSVSVYLCALSFLPLPPHAVLAFANMSEAECPLQEEGESPKEELVARSSARRRSNDQLPSSRNQQPRNTFICFQQHTSSAGLLPAIVGHRLSNGHCAPLLI